MRLPASGDPTIGGARIPPKKADVSRRPPGVTEETVPVSSVGPYEPTITAPFEPIAGGCGASVGLKASTAQRHRVTGTVASPPRLGLLARSEPDACRSICPLNASKIGTESGT